MKKFRFPLDTVLSYKQQVLDALRGEHAAILAEVHTQEEWVEHLWQEYRAYSEEYRQRSAEGLVMTEALMYQTGLRSIEREIQRETEKLDALRAKEEAKRAEVVEAKKETSSIEKLREKKLDAYHKEEAKSEEIFIEEFVSTMRVVSQANG
ncbi:MAG: flagellar export protein FliJ [Oscillibacter sp.]|nr:flagellar export protein FliJ [Oscillibacter sp.]